MRWRAALLGLVTTAIAVVLIVLAVLCIPGLSYLAAFPHIFTGKVIGPILERLPYTLELIGVSFLVASVLAFGCVQFSIRTLKPLATFLAVVLRCVPFFWLAMVLQLVFAILGGFQAGKTSGSDRFDLVDHLRYLAGASGALTLFQLPSLIEYFNKRLAVCAKGRNNFAASILSGLAVQFAENLPDVITATIITELVFAWPGVGRLLYSGDGNLSASLPTGILLFLALLVLAVRFVTEAFARSPDEGASDG